MSDRLGEEDLMQAMTVTITITDGEASDTETAVFNDNSKAGLALHAVSIDLFYKTAADAIATLRSHKSEEPNQWPTSPATTTATESRSTSAT